MIKPSFPIWSRIASATIYSPSSSAALLIGMTALDHKSWFHVEQGNILWPELLALWGCLGFLASFYKKEKTTLYMSFHMLSIGLYSLASVATFLGQADSLYVMFTSIGLCHLDAINQQRAWEGLHTAVKQLEAEVLWSLQAREYGTNHNYSPSHIHPGTSSRDLSELSIHQGKEEGD